MDLDLYLDDFYLHPDLPISSIIKDSDLIKATCVTKPENFNTISRPVQKQDKNYRKQMKKSPKLVKFTGKKIKFTNKGPISSNIEYGIKAKEEEITKFETKKVKNNEFGQRIILPHELKVGDKIVFTTKFNPELKGGVVKETEGRSVSIGVCENASGENFSFQELSRVISVFKGDFHEIRSFN